MSFVTAPENGTVFYVGPKRFKAASPVEASPVEGYAYRILVQEVLPDGTVMDRKDKLDFNPRQLTTSATSSTLGSRVRPGENPDFQKDN